MEERDFVPPEAVVRLTGISRAALAQLRYTGKGPRFYKPTARTVLYRVSEVVAWVDASAHTRTDRPVELRR